MWRWTFVAKPYESFSSFDELAALRCTINWMSTWTGSYSTTRTEGYMQAVPKWKAHSTVDLSVTPEGKLMTCDGHEVEVGNMDLPDGSFGVWEFAFDIRSGCLVAKRPRPDKPQANSAHIVQKNLYNSVPGTIFTGQGFYLMRKYHNRVKRWAITQARDAGATLFDIGTGQGGDLAKWKKTSRVFCVEPDLESMKEMWSRCDDDMSSKITPYL